MDERPEGPWTPLLELPPSLPSRGACEESGAAPHAREMSHLPENVILLTGLQCWTLFIFLIFKMFLFIFERERQNTSRGGAEREEDTES